MLLFEAQAVSDPLIGIIKWGWREYERWPHRLCFWQCLRGTRATVRTTSRRASGRRWKEIWRDPSSPWVTHKRLSAVFFVLAVKRFIFKRRLFAVECFQNRQLYFANRLSEAMKVRQGGNHGNRPTTAFTCATRPHRYTHGGFICERLSEMWSLSGFFFYLTGLLSTCRVKVLRRRC